MIYVVKRFDFDNWENHSPEYETILGYCETKKEADEIVKRKTKSTKRYQGWDGQDYPKFKVEKLKIKKVKSMR